MTWGDSMATIWRMDGTGVDTSGDTRLSAYLKALASRRGYDLEVARGAKGRLSEDAGISRTTLSRALNEGRVPDTLALAGLAKALKVDLETFLVEGGVIPPELATGRTYSSESLSAETQRILALLEALSPDDRVHVLALIESLASRARAVPGRVEITPDADA